MPQRTQIMLAAVLAVVLVVVVVYQLTREPPAPPPTPKSTLQTQEKAAAPAGGTTAPAAPATGAPAGKSAAGPTALKQTDIHIESLLAEIKEVNFDYDKERQARDPMMPLVGKVAKLEPETEQNAALPPATVGQILNKNVSGIVWDKNSPVAVVDNEVVYPGYEYADGTKVIAIERDRVIFKVGDSPIEVKLKEL